MLFEVARHKQNEQENTGNNAVPAKQTEPMLL